jgi:hypothetical protein
MDDQHNSSANPDHTKHEVPPDGGGRVQRVDPNDYRGLTESPSSNYFEQAARLGAPPFICVSAIFAILQTSAAGGLKVIAISLVTTVGLVGFLVWELLRRPDR